MKYIKKILKFLNLLDKDENLSITNIAVIVLLTKIALINTLDWPVVASLLLALINYGHKRTKLTELSEKQLENIQETVKTVSETVKKITN